MLMQGLVMALSAFFIVIQLPYKKLWVPRLWVVDAALFAGLLYLVLIVRSTDISLTAAAAGVIFTVLIRVWQWTYGSKYC